MNYEIFGTTANNDSILLYTAKDEATANIALDVFKKLSKQHMLVDNAVYINKIFKKDPPVTIPFNAYIYIDVHEVFTPIDMDALIKENIDESDSLLDAVSAYKEEVSELLQEYCETMNTIDNLMQFITIEKDKVYYSETESYGEMLGYVVPCIFNVDSFLQNVKKGK